jgi:hypothetical protein
MEALIAILLVGVVGALLSLPVVLVFHLTKRWKHYRLLWLLLVLADIAAAAFFLTSLLAPRRSVSGPTGPFGDAPIQLLWVLAFLAALFSLVYAFIWGFPRVRNHAA